MNSVPDFSRVLFARHVTAWQSVALILAAMETWTVLRDALSSLTQKASCFPWQQQSTLSRANVLPWLSERHAAAVPFSSTRPLLRKLLFPLSSPCHNSSLLARLSWARMKGEEKAEGWDGCGPLSRRREAALLQSSDSPAAAAAPRIPRAAILNCSQDKAVYTGCFSIYPLLGNGVMAFISWIYAEGSGWIYLGIYKVGKNRNRILDELI